MVDVHQFVSLYPLLMLFSGFCVVGLGKHKGLTMVQFVKPRENPSFLKNGKMVISIKI